MSDSSSGTSTVTGGTSASIDTVSSGATTVSGASGSATTVTGGASSAVTTVSGGSSTTDTVSSASAAISYSYVVRSPFGSNAIGTIIKDAATIEALTASGQIANCTRFLPQTVTGGAS